MAMEQYLHDSMPQIFNKQDDASLNKWKHSSELLDESVDVPSDNFDCNICLETVHDPVVTLCGHLYCWPCIYKWFRHQKTSESIDKKNTKCPVCKTEVSQNDIVPLYARGKTKTKTKTSESLSEKKDLNHGITIPRRPARCNLQTLTTLPSQQVNRRVNQHARMNMISPTSPTTGMLGEIVYERIFGNSYSGLFQYPNSYNLERTSTQRERRQAMQAERSLSRICFFLLCCVMLCLFLF